jgi:hypothetical protein
LQCSGGAMSFAMRKREGRFRDSTRKTGATRNTTNLNPRNRAKAWKQVFRSRGFLRFADHI